MSLTREGIAYRVAQDLPEGAYVNLGIGIPTLVSSYIPEGREVFFHSENGLLGMGPIAEPGHEDPDLINAGKQYVTLLPGASVFDHPTSFSMIRGGHVTHAVLGALQVAANGDLANWRTPGEKVPGVGGAMDLAFGVHNVIVTMTHVTNKGKAKIVAQCTLPLTAPRCVKHLYTDMALIDVTPEGLVLREFAPGLNPAAVQALTEAPLRVAPDCREMKVPAAFHAAQAAAR
ncbi:MAG TPA: 3-oxoacid CoA-transferase subunit B [Candidatus Baltobacteraceae bacterium]|jgi:3-oxoacid CoA-transferase B subunit|nr:3-oxoacid CoA-transferase subunit B [Candidatus Baltobacteraceae bacterium]